MDTVQIQKHRINSIESKLDRIADLLELLVKAQVREAYPDEARMRSSFVKRCEAIIRGIKSGKLKTRTYKSMSEFAKTHD